MKEPNELPEGVQMLVGAMFIGMGLLLHAQIDNAPNPDDDSLGDVPQETARKVIEIMAKQLQVYLDGSAEEVLATAYRAGETYMEQEAMQAMIQKLATDGPLAVLRELLGDDSITFTDATTDD